MTVLMALLLSQLDAGVSCAGASDAQLSQWQAEVMGIADWQRLAYAEQLLEEHQLRCPSFISAVTPERIVGLDGPVKVSWAPTTEGPLCFRSVLVTTHGVSSTTVLDAERCAAADESGKPHLTLEDFNFDGRLDVRLWGPLSFVQSQRFDLVLLQQPNGRFEYSPALSQLDDAQPDPKTKTIRSRVAAGAQASHQVTWRWRKGELVQFKK